MAPEATAVLVIRAWREAEGGDGLRTRITSTLDTTSGEEAVRTSDDVEDVCDAVRAWLHAFLAS